MVFPSERQSKPLRIGLVAGEASGDVLAAPLMAELKHRYPQVEFYGVGGSLMQEQGLSSLFDMDELSVMGIIEVLTDLPHLLRRRREVVSYFTQHAVDVFIGIDAPDFNLYVETKLKRIGIKTVHYVSPTIWAWRESRIQKIKQATDLVLGVFPFEREIYQKYQHPFSFVGHSSTLEIPAVIDRVDQKAKLGIDGQAMALLPGSRRKEVEQLLPIFLEVAERVIQQHANLTVLIPAANDARKKHIQDIIVAQASHGLASRTRVFDGNARQLMMAADCGLLASGTAALEAMLCQLPSVVCYRLPVITYWLMKRLYRPAFFALPNILAEQEIMPERIQQAVNADELTALCLSHLTEVGALTARTYQQYRTALECPADNSAAQQIIHLVESV